MGDRFLMKINIIENNLGKAIILEGSLDIYTATYLEKKIEEGIINSNQMLVVDLLKVDYIDSSGIGSLIKIFNLVKRIRGKFCITRLQKPVQQIFQVAGLISYFNILTEKDYEYYFSGAKNNIKDSGSI